MSSSMKADGGIPVAGHGLCPGADGKRQTIRTRKVSTSHLLFGEGGTAPSVDFLGLSSCRTTCATLFIESYIRNIDYIVGTSKNYMR